MKKYAVINGHVLEHRKRDREPAVVKKLFLNNLATESTISINEVLNRRDITATIDLTDGFEVKNEERVTRLLNTVVRNKVDDIGVIYDAYRIFITYEIYNEHGFVEDGVRVVNGIVDELIRPLPLDEMNRQNYIKTTFIKAHADFKAPDVRVRSIMWAPDPAQKYFFKVTNIQVVADTYVDSRVFNQHFHPSRQNAIFRPSSDTCAAMRRDGITVFDAQTTAQGREIIKKLNIDTYMGNSSSFIGLDLGISLDIFVDVYNEAELIKLVKQNQLDRDRPQDNKPPQPTPKPPFTTVTVIGRGSGCTLDEEIKSANSRDNVKFVIDVPTTSYFKFIVIDGVKYDTYHDIPKVIAKIGYTHGNSFVVEFPYCISNHSFYIAFADADVTPEDPSIEPTPDDPKDVYDIRMKAINCHIDHDLESVNVGDDAVFVCDFKGNMELDKIYINGSEYSKVEDIPVELNIEVIPLTDTVVAYKFNDVTREFVVTVAYKEKVEEPVTPPENETTTDTEETPSDVTEA